MSTLIILQWSIIIALALVALVRGAGVFVAGASSLGITYGIRPFLVGVFIVGLGTSLPEFATGLSAVWQGVTDVVVANVVGSNITNILLIGGVLAVLSRAVIIKQDLLRSELPLFVIATVHFVLVLADGVISRIEGALLVITLGAYLWYLFTQNGTSRVTEAVREVSPYRLYDAYTMVLAGALVTMLGAHFAVEGLAVLATGLGISVSILTIVIIAIGTSLPELAVTYQAVRSQETEMAVGNLFGSNAFNILLVAGVPALLVPLTAEPVILELGLYVLVAASVIFFVIGLAKRIMPWEGVMMLAFYGFFLVSLLKFL